MSRRYSKRLPASADMSERFMAKTDRTPGGCWLWNGYTNAKGYGRFTLHGVDVWAHRAAYTLFVGPIPEGMHLDHLCRTPSCVNPAHLEPVAPAENTRRGLKGVLRTHCARGHEMTEDNTYRWQTKRICRTCNRENVRAFYARQESAQARRGAA